MLSLLWLLLVAYGLNFLAPTGSSGPSSPPSSFTILANDSQMYQSKIFKMAYAISIAEGWYFDRMENANFLGSQSYRNHNPGNLRSSTYQVGIDSGFAVFENDQVGFYAIVHQLWLYASGNSKFAKPNDTIEKVMSRYNSLPIATDDFQNYISIIEKIGGVSRKDPISILIK